jgi:transcriptional regulator with XRE-family HTH domain
MTLKDLIRQRGLSLAAFARVLNISNQALQNWCDRGIPGARVFDVADALNVPCDTLRSMTSEGRKPEAATEAELRRFKGIFRQLDKSEQQRFLQELRDLSR